MENIDSCIDNKKIYICSIDPYNKYNYLAIILVKVKCSFRNVKSGFLALSVMVIWISLGFRVLFGPDKTFKDVTFNSSFVWLGTKLLSMHWLKWVVEK